MPRRNENILSMLMESPWWVSVIVAFIMYIFVKSIFPAILSGSPLFNGITKLLSSWAIWIAIFFLIPGAISALAAWKRGELLKSQTSIKSIQNLSWQRFEELVGEAYRRTGYSVIGNSGPGADGGVDIIAEKDGESILIQCKHWKVRTVGVKTVREMFGILNSARANEVHVITSGYFTSEAEDFARNKPMKLINGAMLVQLVGNVQSTVCTKVSAVTEPLRTQTEPRVLCPKCGSAMVIRKATRGANVGKEFGDAKNFHPAAVSGISNSTCY